MRYGVSWRSTRWCTVADAKTPKTMPKTPKTPKTSIDFESMPAELRMITYDQAFLAAIVLELRELNARIAELIALTKVTKVTSR